MPIEVTMPKLSPTMESGVITQWLVKVGDVVKEEDILAEVETDKATMPMKSYEDGTVAHLDVAVGDEVALGQRVLVLAKKGEDPKQVAASLQGGGKSAPAESKANAGAGREGPRAGRGDDADSPRIMTRSGPIRRRRPNGRPPRTTARRPGPLRPRPSTRTPWPAPAGAGGSSRARWPARSRRPPGSTSTRSRGAGPGAGWSATTSRPSSRPAPPPRRPRPLLRPPPARLAAGRIPHTRMRKTIAQRMVQAKQEAPEIHVTVDARVDEIVAIRERLNKQLAAEKVKLSLGDFVTKAVALALRRHPAVNASFEPDAIVIHPEVHVGIAVAIEGGLIVPVLHNADTLGLREIRTTSEALAEAARKGTLTGEQLTGGTFTISNLGMYGVRQFDAILNLPQVGILAVGAAEKRPVVVGDALAVGDGDDPHPDRRPPRRRRRDRGRVPADPQGPARRTRRDAPVISRLPIVPDFARPFPRPRRRGWMEIWHTTTTSWSSAAAPRAMRGPSGPRN